MSETATIQSTAEKLAQQFQGKRLPADVADEVKRSLRRMALLEHAHELDKMDTLGRWLDWIYHLPWYEESKDNLSLEDARKILDEGHYGMEKIKERVLDFIAAQKLTAGKAKGMVLCFVGPPGTGKTTISKIIAEALGRKFVRISMASLGDVSQIRGKSRFQPDAEPSLIIKGMRRAGVRNPVICLDEIDKVGGGGLLGGETMAAFLEILDPEQNSTFSDHFVDYPYDLSHVLFIGTANKLLGAESPILDRIELISLPDYNREDKKYITQTFVIPQKMKEAGLTQNGVSVTFADDIWSKILDPYKWDSGMRTTQHTIGEILFRVARQVISTGQKEYTISAANLKDYILL
ncbi:MAG TPA: AAA family ATPase [bacterium]|nr:AAA family ATPase [bacterium]